MAYRLHPKRLYHYWFSREGGIMALKIIGIGIIAMFILMVGMFAYFRKDLPNITDVSGNNLNGSISYYDRTGKILLFQDYSAEKRTPVPTDQISGYMKDATIAIEDKSFYHEGAFNVKGIARAGFHDLFNKSEGLQGGSTITQQLVKLNENWTNQRTITRKIKEVILAVELEREYSKDEILTGYLNAAPYGGIEYGVEAAAQDYFHTTAKKLTLAQATMLASIPRDPPYYSPYSDPKYNASITADYFDESALITRQHYVLDQMAEQGMISQDEADAAKKVDVLAQVNKLQPKYQNIKAPYFVLAAKQELQNKYGAATVNHGGWRVTTSLDMKIQDKAEKLVQQNLPNVRQYGGDEEALTAENVNTGQMVALVGGVDFTNADHGQINYAQINISPGSSVKPYDYATLINESKNAGAGSVLYDSLGPLPGYPCTNHNQPKYGGNCLVDYDYYRRTTPPGPLTLRYALGGSRNIPAVKAMLTVGTDKVISTANAMMGNSDAYKCYQPGVNVENAPKSQEAQCYGSSAIGDGAYLHLDQHVNGLATLARLGKEIPQTYILKIQDSNSKTIDQWTQPKGTQVIKPDSAYIVDNMASDPRASYLPGSCSNYSCTPLGYGGFKFHRYKGYNVAIKTGTTNDNFDGLMTAWTTQYAVASWVGYHTRNQAMNSGGMEYMTEPLTRPLMEYALDTVQGPAVNWKAPTGIKTEKAFVVYNHVGVGSQEPSPSTDIYPSWYVAPVTKNVNANIDKVSGKLATSCTPADAKQFMTNSNAASFSIDKWVTGGATGSYNTSANDDVHKCDDDKPNATLTVSSNGGGGGDTCDNSGCTVTVTVTQGTHPLASSKFPLVVKINVDGKTVKTFTSTDGASPQTFSYSFNPKNGDSTVNALVTDSVLYQTTSNSAVISGGGGDGNGNGNGGGFGNGGGGFGP